MIRALALLCVLLTALVAAAPASALPPKGSTAPVVVQIVGVREVGFVVQPAAPVQTGATCQWMRSGTAISGATSCSGYTVTTADVSAGANALALQIKTNGVTVYAALTISGSCPTTGTVGTAYSCSSIAAANGATPYTYALSGAWPAGVSIASSTGVVSGAPTAAGTFSNLSVAANDPAGGSASISPFTLVISGGGGCTTGALIFNCAANSAFLGVIR